MNAKLETLNAYRARAGKQPLKAWKEAIAKIDLAIARYAKLDPTFDAKEAANHRAETAEARLAAKDRKVDAKTSTKEVKAQLEASLAETNGATVTLAQIAREIGANPKIVRARMRRAADFSERGIDGKWVFPVSTKADIIAFLTK